MPTSLETAWKPSRLTNWLGASAISCVLVSAFQSALAAPFDFSLYGPPGPTGYGEFFQSAQSPAADPSCASCVDGGVLKLGTDVSDTYDAWVKSVLSHHGVAPGSFFGEDFDGPGWSQNLVFDSQEATSGVPIIVDGVTMSNDLPDVLAGFPNNLPLNPGRAEKPAKADHSPGSSPAIDKFAWEARDDFGPDTGKVPEATIDFSKNKTDFLGFYIFDASKTGTYNLQYTDGTIFSLTAKETDNQNSDNDGFYRFIGFVNTHPTAQINRFWATNAGSRYGIDEIEWGRGNGFEVPEPGTMALLAAGLVMALSRKGRRASPSQA